MTEAATKLAAAIDAVREHLLGLGSATRVILVAFNQAADVVFDGASSDHEGVREALATIDAAGGTNMAAALERASNVVDRAPDERVFCALVVSDGLSELEPAEAAARRLARRASWWRTAVSNVSRAMRSPWQPLRPSFWRPEQAK